MPRRKRTGQRDPRRGKQGDDARRLPAAGGAWMERLARIGLAAKGVVYILVGSRSATGSEGALASLPTTYKWPRRRGKRRRGFAAGATEPIRDARARSAVPEHPTRVQGRE
jgi:hypothetical protein